MSFDVWKIVGDDDVGMRRKAAVQTAQTSFRPLHAGSTECLQLGCLPNITIAIPIGSYTKKTRIFADLRCLTMPTYLLKLALPITLIWAMHVHAAAQANIQSPDEFLPHQIGQQFTPHHMLVDYFEYLAKSAPKTMVMQRYGTTNEGRPLVLAIFSSPENMAALEQIRQGHLHQAGLSPVGPAGAPQTAIVWLSMSVHGNEPSGSECSMPLAWQLAVQTDPEVRAWLKNTVVILDPSLNPDGYDRYTHWYRMSSNKLPNPDPNTREHKEPWPGGRTNHYYFDLNRDWAWATQVETRQRLAVYHQWLPHIHADLHEQYYDSPYYFAPAAEPMHAYITRWQRDFQTEIGANHAKYFDANGWLYFTKEVFDLFYPSYGDTYPMFNGAIGMTYEQAGHSRAGRAIITPVGDTLTLTDRIAHHLSTSRSTIEMASKHSERLVRNFREYYQKAATQPQGDYTSFIVPVASNGYAQINNLCDLLDRHQIRYGQVGAAGVTVKGFSYKAGEMANYSIQTGDLLISAHQPHGVLVQALFDPESKLSDSLTYDATAWAIPFAHGLDAYAIRQKMEPKAPFKRIEIPKMKIAASPYAWCVHRHSIRDMQFLAALLRAGVRVRYAEQPFAMSDQQFEAGAIVANRADNGALGVRFDEIILEAAAQSNVQLHPIYSGMSSRGRDLGSDVYKPIDELRAAVVFGEEVDELSFGQTWHFFEHDLQHPLSVVALDRLEKINLGDYTTIIFPNGQYNLSDQAFSKLQAYMRQGGKVVAFDGGVRAFAGKEGVDLNLKASKESESDEVREPEPYTSKERARVSESLPGAILMSKADISHPLAFGLGNQYATLKNSADAYSMNITKGSVAIWVPEKYASYGFIGSKIKSKLAQTPVAMHQQVGQGKLVLLVDNPLFRGMWEKGKMLFANALLF